MFSRYSIYRGHHYGDISLAHDLEFHGLVHGSVTVACGRQLWLRGRIAGDLIVEKDGLAAVHGTIGGMVRNHGAHVLVWGAVGGVHDSGHRRTHVNHLVPIKRINNAAAIQAGAGPYGQLTPPPARRDPVLSDREARAGWTSWITG